MGADGGCAVDLPQVPSKRPVSKALVLNREQLGPKDFLGTHRRSDLRRSEPQKRSHGIPGLEPRPGSVPYSHTIQHSVRVGVPNILAFRTSRHSVRLSFPCAAVFHTLPFSGHSSTSYATKTTLHYSVHFWTLPVCSSIPYSSVFI